VPETHTSSRPGSVDPLELPSLLRPSIEAAIAESDLQEIFAVRAAAVERMDSGHPPFYSMPGELARLLNRVALASVVNGTSVNGEHGEGK
jgi:hypothetical protein